jgi:steroid delta-isomerase-like uncharacterized protein
VREQETSTANINRELVLEAWRVIGSRRDTAAVEKYFATDYIRHSFSASYSRDDLRRILENLRQGFPDLETVNVDVFGQADRVAYRWEATGTHLGSYLGVPATHKRISAGGINIARIENGLIAEEWSSWDKVSFLHALGIIPIG